ncbi:hypothetical protein SprV_0100003600 [Sparganum proliferum]
MPVPKNVSQFLSSLVLIGYFSAFLPLLHDLRVPLNRLLLVGCWCWSSAVEDFSQLNSVLRSDPLLTHYDTTLPIVVAADAFNRGVEQRKYTCEFCGVDFGLKCNLKSHVECVHEKQRKYTCEFCGVDFGQMGVLKRHVECVHEKQRKYTCEFCGVDFGWKRSLKRHVECVHEIHTAFDSWYKRYEDLFSVDLAAQDDAWKVRLLLRKLGPAEHERYANFILPKNPREVTFQDTVQTLPQIFGEQSSFFNIRFQCLQLCKRESDDFITYAGIVNRECGRPVKRDRFQ